MMARKTYTVPTIVCLVIWAKIAIMDVKETFLIAVSVASSALPAAIRVGPACQATENLAHDHNEAQGLRAAMIVAG